MPASEVTVGRTANGIATLEEGGDAAAGVEGSLSVDESEPVKLNQVCAERAGHGSERCNINTFERPVPGLFSDCKFRKCGVECLSIFFLVCVSNGMSIVLVVLVAAVATSVGELVLMVLVALAQFLGAGSCLVRPRTRLAEVHATFENKSGKSSFYSINK